MKHLPKISRILLGLLFFIFGAAGLFNLIPPPPDLPPALTSFTNAMMATGYFFPFIKITETICGLLLLINIAPALMLIILAPISIQIFLLHFFLTPGIQNLVIPILIIILGLVAAKAYWPIYRPLFNRNK